MRAPCLKLLQVWRSAGAGVVAATAAGKRFSLSLFLAGSAALSQYLLRVITLTLAEERLWTGVLE